MFGYENHLGIDRRHGFIRSFAVTDAARHDGRQVRRLLDPHNTASEVFADTAYRSAANVALARRGLVPRFQRRSRAASQCRRPSPAAIPPGADSGRDRARLRRAKVPARPARPLGRLACATARLGLANLVTNVDPPWLVRDPSRTGLRAGGPKAGPTLSPPTIRHRPPTPLNSDRILHSRSPHCPVLRNVLACASLVSTGAAMSAGWSPTSPRSCCGGY
jgi:Transposase DDE domain